VIRTRLIAAALVLLLCPFAGAAETGIRTTVALPSPRECAAPVSVATLAQAYYGQPADALTETVVQVLDACEISATIQTRYVVILFAGKPTAGGNVTLIHLLFDAARHEVMPQFTLLGVDAGTWIFLSDDKSDAAVVQLTSVPVQNPILGQLGRLASTIVPKFSAAAAPAQQRHAIYVSASPSTPLPLKRAVFTEADCVGRG
jgi:hypothetical protein